MPQKTTKTILVLLHRNNGSTGQIGHILQGLGYDLDIRCTLAGDELPCPSTYAGVIVFGGLMSANDCHILPGIRQEMEWIPSVIAADIPYLGICLGAQLLARTLGAGVSRKSDNSVEIGFHHVRPLNKNSTFLPATGIRFYQWHVEEFSIPDKCERLAESDNFANQAFQLNNKTIGLQFHPEATREMIDYWVSREPDYLSLTGAQSYKTQVELFRECNSAVTQWTTQFLHNWLHASV